MGVILLFLFFICLIPELTLQGANENIEFLLKKLYGRRKTEKTAGNHQKNLNFCPKY